MKGKLLLFSFGLAACAFAADPPALDHFDSNLLPPLSLYDRSNWQSLLTPKPYAPVFVLGKSDFVFSGPLAEGFRRLPPAENLSRGQKFLRLPIIRLFVPKPMPVPPEGGRYFGWRNCSLSWGEAASRPPIQKGPE